MIQKKLWITSSKLYLADLLHPVQFYILGKCKDYLNVKSKLDCKPFCFFKFMLVKKTTEPKKN